MSAPRRTTGPRGATPPSRRRPRGGPRLRWPRLAALLLLSCGEDPPREPEGGAGAQAQGGQAQGGQAQGGQAQGGQAQGGGGSLALPLPSGGGGGETTVADATCASGRRWSRADTGSPEMHPGGACIQCHVQMGDQPTPSLLAAGTIYGTSGEATDCNGIDGQATGAEVILTDADGVEITLPVNQAGNFLLRNESQVFRFPLRARVVAGGKERAMKQAQGTGDCNLCHGAEGKQGAPGRLLLP